MQMLNNGFVYNDVEALKRNLTPISENQTKTQDFSRSAKNFGYIHGLDKEVSGYLSEHHYEVDYDSIEWQDVYLAIGYSPTKSAIANIKAAGRGAAKALSFEATRDMISHEVDMYTQSSGNKWLGRLMTVFTAPIAACVTVPMDLLAGGVHLLGAVKDLADAAVHGVASIVYTPDYEA